MKRWFLILFVACGMVACQDDQPAVDPVEPGPTEYVEPVPPVKVVDINLFQVRYATTLSTTSLFAQTDYTALKRRIEATPYVMIAYLDRADATLFESTPKNPTVSLARELKYVSLFIPFGYDEKGSQGTGILTKGVVTEFIRKSGGDSFAITGQSVYMPAETYFNFLSGSCRVDQVDQFDAFATAAHKAVADGMCVIGSVKSSLADDLYGFFKNKFDNYRWRTVKELNNKEYTLFVLTPLRYVYRSSEITSLSGGIEDVILNIEVLPNL